MKIREIGAELFHADGQTDMTKLIVAFRNSVNAPKCGGFYEYDELQYYRPKGIMNQGRPLKRFLDV